MMVDSPKKYISDTIASGCKLNPARGVEEYRQNIVNLRDQLLQLIKTKVISNTCKYLIYFYCLYLICLYLIYFIEKCGTLCVKWSYAKQMKAH